MALSRTHISAKADVAKLFQLNKQTKHPLILSMAMSHLTNTLTPP